MVCLDGDGLESTCGRRKCNSIAEAFDDVVRVIECLVGERGSGLCLTRVLERVYHNVDELSGVQVLLVHLEDFEGAR